MLKKGFKSGRLCYSNINEKLFVSTWDVKCMSTNHDVAVEEFGVDTLMLL